MKCSAHHPISMNSESNALFIFNESSRNSPQMMSNNTVSNQCYQWTLAVQCRSDFHDRSYNRILGYPACQRHHYNDKSQDLRSLVLFSRYSQLCSNNFNTKIIGMLHRTVAQANQPVYSYNPNHWCYCLDATMAMSPMASVDVHYYFAMWSIPVPIQSQMLSFPIASHPNVGTSEPVPIHQSTMHTVKQC